MFDRPDPAFPCGTSWVRIALQQCRALERGRALNAEVLPLLGFAIRWAPFGGARAEELLLSFGVTRHRFLELVSRALRPRDSDDPHTRQLKRHLRESLAWAWRADPGRPAPGALPAPAAAHRPAAPAPSVRARPTASIRARA
ncbi:hypothetical protein [Nocardia carnea]|uniref:hypothetical protein n=1 Tax=Nocardia carnea TaxID=37328 RepID=UPI002458B2D4|nr:hypothetical protein [Nocardia carnea]